MTKVCITGSAGFIGSNLVEACLNLGWDVVGVDNLSTGHDDMTDPIRVMDLPGHYGFCNLDINETDKLAQVFVGCDVVFHLAALARVPFSIDHPMKAHEANATGTLSVLEAARRAKVGRVVFACSSSIFGGTAAIPTKEDAITNPLSPYAAQKLYGAQLMKMYSELHSIDTVSLIFYNVFAKYQRTSGAYSSVISAFCEAAINNGSCRIDHDGSQFRDFCHVENVIQACILAAEHKQKLNGEMFNVANQKTYSVNDVYEKIKELNGGKLKKHYAKKRPGDPEKSQADISKTKRVLGYKPKVGFDDGLRMTFEWWKAGCPIKWRK